MKNALKPHAGLVNCQCEQFYTLIINCLHRQLPHKQLIKFRGCRMHIYFAHTCMTSQVATLQYEHLRRMVLLAHTEIPLGQRILLSEKWSVLFRRYNYVSSKLESELHGKRLDGDKYVIVAYPCIASTCTRSGLLFHHCKIVSILQG